MKSGGGRIREKTEGARKSSDDDGDGDGRGRKSADRVHPAFGSARLGLEDCSVL